jgi:hypothetical protein
MGALWRTLRRPAIVLEFLTLQAHHLCMNSVTPIPGTRSANHVVAFHRTELNVILSLYGRMVAAGEWRDYGISTLKDMAVFSVFRRTAENPLYRIEKRPKLRDRQGQFVVVGMDGQILKRGHDLKTVLRVLERKLIRAVD